jgi:hypothetical protein
MGTVRPRPKHDLTGRSVGSWTVKEVAEQRMNGGWAWICECACGNVKPVSASSLVTGKSLSCGCTILADILGKQYGRLTVIERIAGKSKYRCSCVCGGTTETTSDKLQKGHTSSCGCYQKERTSEASRVDLTARVFGRLTAIMAHYMRSQWYWECRCECGKRTYVETDNLSSGNTTSCGCLHREISAACLRKLHPNQIGPNSPSYKAITNAQFISEALTLHGNKYDYCHLPSVLSAKVKIEIGCPKHGRFIQMVYAHLDGNGCGQCADEISADKRRKSTDYFVQKAMSVHGKDRYDYSLTRLDGMKNKLTIVCPLPGHGVFHQNASSHISGCGCPICEESHGEQAIRVFCDSHNLVYTRQYQHPTLKDRRALKIDFVVEIGGKNFAIEFNGEQHYRPVKYRKSETDEVSVLRYKRVQQRDTIKRNWCDKNGFLLKEIRFDCQDITGVVSEFLGIRP